MQNKGEIIEKAVRQSGYPITLLAKKLNKSRRWLYNVFESVNVRIDIILNIGEAIHHDFSGEINDLKRYKLSSNPDSVREKGNGYGRDEKGYSVEYWKNKYLILLEKHNSSLEKEKKKKSLKPASKKAVKARKKAKR